MCVKKFWAFLTWLVNHNRLYTDIVLDRDRLASLYPEDDPLPGVTECVVHDNELDVKMVFHEETAGFDLHPVSLLNESNTTTSSDANSSPGVIMIEKMGISDPECNKVSG